MKHALVKFLFISFWASASPAAMAQPASFVMPIISEGTANQFIWQLLQPESPSVAKYRVTFNGNQRCRGTLAMVDDKVVWKIENCSNGGSCIGFGKFKRGDFISGMYHCGLPNRNTFTIDNLFDVSSRPGGRRSRL